jgi:hypothetical protein
MPKNQVSRFILAWLATGVSDFLWAVVLSVGIYKNTFAQLWQGVASVPLGKSAMDGGTRTVVIGILLHFGVALAWTTVFFILTRFGWMQRILNSRWGALKVASVYGPFIWAFMSLLVIPLLLHRSPSNWWPRNWTRWAVQAIGHIVFVALPMIAVYQRSESAAPVTA